MIKIGLTLCICGCAIAMGAAAAVALMGAFGMVGLHDQVPDFFHRAIFFSGALAAMGFVVSLVPLFIREVWKNEQSNR